MSAASPVFEEISIYPSLLINIGYIANIQEIIEKKKCLFNFF